MSRGIGVVNLGHCHPAVTKAAQEQCATITHAQVNIGYSVAQLDLIKELLTIMPHPSLDTFFLWNSGSEAVEAAIKVARMVTGRPNFIVVQGTFSRDARRDNSSHFLSLPFRLIPWSHECNCFYDT